MTQGQGEHESRLCPRCGGLMVKSPGSMLFWHANYQHPRCDITNIVDIPEMEQKTDMPPDEPAKGSRRKK